VNREQRRSIEKQKQSGELRYLQTPCTITEAAQIARGVAEDVVSEYSQQNSPLQVAMSIQIEILKDIVINGGLITEDKFRERYMEKAMEFNQMQKEALNSAKSLDEDESSPKMDLKVSDIEIIKE
jgi:hypothetical protein